MKSEDGNQDCPFCAIAAGRVQARVVFEDERAVAFFPLRPATVGHTLIVPREHVDNFLDVDGSTGAHLFGLTTRVGAALRKVLDPPGMNLISSAGAAAEQTVRHLHLHLVPRWPADPMGKIWPEGEPWVDQLEDRIVEDVRSAVRGSEG